jgi:hypothetical protein
MLIKRLLPFLLLTFAFLFLGMTVYTAPSGNTPTYLSLVSSAPLPTVTPTATIPPDPLPTEPLLLLRQGHDLAWVNGTGTFRRQLTTEHVNNHALPAPDGTTILYYENSGNGSSRHLLLDARGGTPREIQIELDKRQWSPDSRHIAYMYGSDLITYNVTTTLTDTVANAVRSNFGYLWHPILNQLYYVSDRSGSTAIYRVNADGTDEQYLWEDSDEEQLFQVLQDGRLVIRLRSASGYRVVVLNSDGSGVTPLAWLSPELVHLNVHPQGEQLFYQVGTQLYLSDIAGQTITEFTPPCPTNYESCFTFPSAWHPTRNELAFIWAQKNPQSNTIDFTLYTLATDDSQAELRQVDTGETYEMLYSPNGRYLAYQKGWNVVVYDTETQTPSAIIVAPNGDPTELQAWYPIP